jgi:hypothetical protein
MERVNRAAAFVLALLLLAGGALLAAAAWEFPGPYTVTALDGQQFSFSPLTLSDKLVVSAIALVPFLLGLFLFATELLGPPARQHFPLRGLEHGEATVERQSVQDRLAGVLRQIPGVEEALPRARLDRDAVSVEAVLVIDPTAPVPALCEQAHSLIAHTLEHDLGLQPGVVQLRVRLARAREGTGSAAAHA